jgi:FkbM family methyltransferase
MDQLRDVTVNIAQLQQELRQTQSQLLRTRQELASFRAEGALHAAGKVPRFPIEFTAQFGEDLLVWDLFDRQREGFFIEAGAFDGYHYSVTHALEAIGWHGLLVEPLPQPAEQCRRRRPASRVVQAALSRRGAAGSAPFTALEDRYGGMLSYLETNEDHVRQTSGAKRTTVEVPVTSLDQLLTDHSGPIDVVILDVEGGELNVLEGFDLGRHRPRLMIIEDNSMGKSRALTSYMAPYPYWAPVRLAVNLVFVRNDQPEMLDRLRWQQLG